MKKNLISVLICLLCAFALSESASDKPHASLHETLRYKEPDGGIRIFDVQVLTTDTPCEDHQCLEKLIDLGD